MSLYLACQGASASRPSAAYQVQTNNRTSGITPFFLWRSKRFAKKTLLFRKVAASERHKRDRGRECFQDCFATSSMYTSRKEINPSIHLLRWPVPNPRDSLRHFKEEDWSHARLHIDVTQSTAQKSDAFLSVLRHLQRVVCLLWDFCSPKKLNQTSFHLLNHSHVNRKRGVTARVRNSNSSSCELTSLRASDFHSDSHLKQQRLLW